MAQASGTTVKVFGTTCVQKDCTATTLAAALNTSTKTIHRDLHYLKNGLRLPLTYDAHRNAWRLDGAATLSARSAGPSQQNELAALLAAHTKGKKS